MKSRFEVVAVVIWFLLYSSTCYAFSQGPKENHRLTATRISLHEPMSTTSRTLGELRRVSIPGEDDLLSTVAVPTFAAASDKKFPVEEETKRRGLEGALNQGPAFVLDNVLSRDTCDDLISTFESLGFGDYQVGKNHHGALQVVVSNKIASSLGQALTGHIDIDEVDALRIEMDGPDTDDEVRLVYAGLNRRWRVYRYAPEGCETFAPHIDAGFPPSGISEDGTQLIWDASSHDQEIVSRLTVLLYLNDDFIGGETNFYSPADHLSCARPDPSVIAAVRPKAGSILAFPQAVTETAVEYARQYWPLHEGSPVLAGNRPKYVIRSDAMFVKQKEPLLLHDDLWKNDHLVRHAFMPRSPAMDKVFLSQLKSLYNPHMGVENLGPFLYSFIRFNKGIRKVVEIGAGYTSLWIVQALKENDDDMRRIQNLQDSGNCKLLNIDWTISEKVHEYNAGSSKLVFIDNCKHQKETATGASAVANSMGLESYMEFKLADAFELELEEKSVDMLWCDFGVGSRMAEFVSKAWSSIRPGGFMLCHSTLTNSRTREWLEAARSRQDQSITGIPPSEYVEISLLEPHKRFQNSVSIFQKRSANFAEPTYSEYA